MKIELSTFVIHLYSKVYSLWQQCDGIGLSSADSEDSIRTYLQRNPGLSFVAMIDKTIVGVILGGHDGRRGFIHHLAVHPEFRCKGIGRQLVNQCLQKLKLAGIQKCHIFVFHGNSSGLVFWKSEGWHLRSDIGVVSKQIK